MNSENSWRLFSEHYARDSQPGDRKEAECNCPSMDDVFAPHIQIGTKPPCPVHPDPPGLSEMIKAIKPTHFVSELADKTTGLEPQFIKMDEKAWTEPQPDPPKGFKYDYKGRLVRLNTRSPGGTVRRS